MIPLKILIVEDNECDILLYKHYLKNGLAGQEVIIKEAFSAESALTLVDQFKPDSIFLDYQLPDMNGYAFFKELKKSEINLAPCTIVITGEGNEAVAAQFIKEGAVDYLIKNSLTSEVLCSSLKNGLKEQQLKLQLAQKEAALLEANVCLEQTVLELKHKKAELEQKEHHLRQTLDTIPHIIFRFNKNQQLTFMNRKTFEYTGRAIDDHFTLRDYLHPDDLARRASEWESALENNETFSCEYRIKDSLGNYRWMMCKGEPLTDFNGNVYEWIGSCTDVHDSKTHLDELILLKKSLQEKNRLLTKTNAELDNFVYVASHDLNAPIQNLQSLMGFLQEELGDKKEDVSHILQLIEHSVTRLKDAVLNLCEVLTISKQPIDHIEFVSFQEVFDGIVLDLPNLIHDSNARISTDFSQAPFIQLSAKNLRSILYNLFSNALKYRSPSRKCEIIIYTEQNEKEVSLTVKDNGLGLKEADQQRIFTLFERIHTHVDGRGIGMTIVKRILNSCGGKIFVKSELGKGSEFTAIFPLPSTINE